MCAEILPHWRHNFLTPAVVLGAIYLAHGVVEGQAQAKNATFYYSFVSFQLQLKLFKNALELFKGVNYKYCHSLDQSGFRRGKYRFSRIGVGRSYRGKSED